MESIIYHYPYVNQQSCSQLLPFINFLDFTKIIRVFNIRKTSLIPKHILEEKNEDEIAELVLKAKATSVYKKVVEQRPIFVERELKNVQKQLLELKEDRLFIDDTINKYFNNKPQSEVKSVVNDNRKVIKNNIGDNSNIAYCLFSDIHYGKKFDRPIFGRGYNKEIAHERVMEVAHKTVQYCQVYKPTKLIIGFFGDLIENFLEQGFHASQVLNQDLQQDEQIFFAVDSLKEALLYMYDNLSFVNIDMYACFGNHDRMSENRSDDKNRTPAKIAFKILQRELKEKINIYIDKSNIVNVKTGDIQLIGFHGDNSLIKRKNHELVNLYGGGNTTYHLVVSGHYHRTKIETGTNYMGISLPSLASVDDFILEDLGLNNLPGFILGRQTPNQKAFDYSYINLY
jgi:predicted phosphodiesterase